MNPFKWLKSKPEPEQSRKLHVTNNRLEILEWLYANSEELRGCLIGNPNPNPLIEFDNNMSLARDWIEKEKRKRKFYDSKNITAAAK